MSGAGAVAPPAVTVPGRRRSRAALLGLLALAVGVQLVVLYAPDGPGSAPFPHADKVVHVVVFLVPVVLAVLAGLRRRAVLVVFAAHAVLSEVVQAALLPHRSGDAVDAVADLVGIGLGLLVGTALLHVLVRRSQRAAA